MSLPYSPHWSASIQGRSSLSVTWKCHFSSLTLGCTAVYSTLADTHSTESPWPPGGESQCTDQGWAEIYRKERQLSHTKQIHVICKVQVDEDSAMTCGIGSPQCTVVPIHVSQVNYAEENHRLFTNFPLFNLLNIIFPLLTPCWLNSCHLPEQPQSIGHLFHNLNMRMVSFRPCNVDWPSLLEAFIVALWASGHPGVHNDTYLPYCI
jgi:hypothetical protein